MALTTQGAQSVRRQVAWTAVLMLGAGAVFVGGMVWFIGRSYAELNVYILGAQRMIAGEDIYRLEGRVFSYPPLFALVFVPFTILAQAWQRGLWYVVNVLVLVVLFRRLNRLLSPFLNHAQDSNHAEDSAGQGLSSRIKKMLFWGVVVLLSFRHLSAPLENQSHDLLVFLTSLLAIEAFCLGRARRAGFWSGLGAALKATPLLFGLYFLWQRRWGACAALLVAATGWTLLPDLFYRDPTGESWTLHWWRVFVADVRPGASAGLQNTWDPWCMINQSMAGTIYRLTTPSPNAMNVDTPDVCLVSLTPEWRRVVTVIGQLAVFAWLLWSTRPSLARNLAGPERVFHFLGHGAALLIAMVLLSPTSIKTHFCVLLLPIAYCLTHLLYRRRDLFVGVSLVAFCLLSTMTIKGILGIGLGNQVLAYGSVTASALALYLATGRILLGASGGKWSPERAFSYNEENVQQEQNHENRSCRGLDRTSVFAVLSGRTGEKPTAGRPGGCGGQGDAAKVVEIRAGHETAVLVGGTDEDGREDT